MEEIEHGIGGGNRERAISLELVRPGSPLLPRISGLWRANSATLGFFPSGAFTDHAANGGLIAALEEDGSFVGYVAFRRAYRRASIVHLCVDDRARGHGVARLLFEAFREATSDLLGASVTCRADFEATTLWPKLGFMAVGEQPAREIGKTLVRWWHDYGHPDLFSTPSAVATAVIDANVFFDLLDPSDPKSAESAPLRADWLQDAFKLAVTPEVYSEIARAPAAATRERGRRFASLFPLVKGHDVELREISVALQVYLGLPGTVSDESDIKQLAHAIAGAAQYFVTRDQAILNASDAIFKEFQVRAVRPSALIGLHDEDLRPTVYAPARLDGSSLVVRQVRATESDAVAKLFQNYPRGEANTGLPRQLREALSQPQLGATELISDALGNALALTLSGTQSGAHEVRLLRVGADVLGSTLARHALWRHVHNAVDQGARVVRFSDNYSSEGVDHALADVGFVRDSSGWFKPVLRSVYTVEEALTELRDMGTSGLLPPAVVRIAEALASATPASGGNALASLEKLVWPARLIGANLPCFIVPIKPQWSTELFDTASASQRLFAGDPALLLRFENAYYRSARPAVIRAPARVIWYASESRSHARSKQLCAVSSVNEVMIDTPKNVFRVYKRYGVFSFDHVSRLRTDSSGGVMAFTFSHSALLQRAIPFEEASQFIRSRTGKRQTFQSPLEVDEGTWMGLYRLGIQQPEQP